MGDYDYRLVSILTMIVVICLSITHIITFQSNTLKYDYAVDWDHDSKLKINVDMTVAMGCACKYMVINRNIFLVNELRLLVGQHAK